MAFVPIDDSILMNDANRLALSQTASTALPYHRFARDARALRRGGAPTAKKAAWPFESAPVAVVNYP